MWRGHSHSDVRLATAGTLPLGFRNAGLPPGSSRGTACPGFSAVHKSGRTESNYRAPCYRANRMTTAFKIFAACAEAISRNKLIVRESSRDKEFHFQNWFKERLEETGLNFDQGGRNTYPDFTLVKHTDGYELKGLAYPGRDANFDSNSQVPTGSHNGRDIYYVFGRYPKNPDGDRYPVVDLVICHGDFLNADHEYAHKNRSVKGFGSYGDIMIRDRKMYVVPTPFHLVDGVAHHQSLILPASIRSEGQFVCVGDLKRVEAAELIVGYSFNLKTNQLVPKKVPNPGKGREHLFRAWRLKGTPKARVSMRPIDIAELTLDEDDDADE
jgi:hypothetical protein